MKKFLAAAVLLFFCTRMQAQWPKQLALPITDYIIEAGDSVTIVQVKLPAGFLIKDKTFGLVRSVFHSPGDSVVTVGSGRCYLVKGDYYYYGLQKKYMKRKPTAGDLLYTDVSTPSFYTGYVYEVIKHNIVIKNVEEKNIADLDIILQVSSEADELKLLTVMMDDVKYTGKVMAGENNSQDMMITDGKFKDQKLFAAMQAITVADVKYFLQYINARPDKYAGNAWKFSEIMATWMVSGAPMVKN